jgi:hypothetical protein
MLATGHQFDLEPGAAGCFAQRAETQQCRFGARRLGGGDNHPLLPLVLDQPVFQFAGGCRSSADDRPVRLAGFPLPKGFRQPIRGFRRPGEDCDSADGGVEPADDPDIDVARLVVFAF